MLLYNEDVTQKLSEYRDVIYNYFDPIYKVHNVESWWVMSNKGRINHYAEVLMEKTLYWKEMGDFYLLILETGREKHWFVVPLIHALIGWFLYVPWLGIKPTTLAYGADALTHWPTQAGPL